MSRKTFENYGKLAGTDTGYTEMSGRYPQQSHAERTIVPDLLSKLNLEPHHRVLEVGCGAGNLLIPISFLVHSIDGVDHPAIIDRLKTRYSGTNVNLRAGNFLDLQIEQRFDRVLVYSVVHCLAHHQEVQRFIDLALETLVPGGIALFGDIPNQDKKARFLASEEGQVFEAAWKAEVSTEPNESQKLLGDDDTLVRFGDEDLQSLVQSCRREGHEAFLLEQATGLPFSRTREDLLVKKKLP